MYDCRGHLPLFSRVRSLWALIFEDGLGGNLSLQIAWTAQLLGHLHFFPRFAG